MISHAEWKYGTAGFRADATCGTRLDSVMVRMGALMALRSRTARVAVGAIVTASHNLEPDNGLKMVDVDGGMLTKEWEDMCTRVANATHWVQLNIAKATLRPRVFVGRDTRASSPRLCALLCDAVRAQGGEVIDLGEVPTPVVHWIVREFNTGRGTGAVHEYFDALAAAFEAATPACTTATLVIDCANGVGAVSARELARRLALPIELLNTGGVLNDRVGAEHVQKERQFPLGVDPVRDVGRRFVSIDGDADRLVYFFSDPQTHSLRLLDGDKIMALLSGYVLDLLRHAGITSLRVGAVQTAYANGASTHYLTRTLGLDVVCVPTGVKHLHHVASTFDIGVYFEANGHGTVLFSDVALATFAVQEGTPEATDARRRLITIARLANQAVGDAFSNILLVEVILAWRSWSLTDWDALYTDLPSRQLKVHVRDSCVLQTTDAERRCVVPAGLQDAIDALVSQYVSGRAFVRPSGTENVVRVYAEGDHACALADAVAENVRSYF